MTKVCTKCNEAKPLELFNKRSRSKDGRSYWCKACHIAHNKAWRDDDEGGKKRAHLRELQKKWRGKNPDNEKARVKKYYETHKEQILARKKLNWDNRSEERLALDAEKSRAYRMQKHVRERKRAWDTTNRERLNELTNAWKRANPEKRYAQHRRWTEANPEKVREYGRAASRRRVEVLPDHYIRNLLLKEMNSRVCVPQELIELKRAQLKLQRELKEKLS
jgi:hypothetical protein